MVPGPGGDLGGRAEDDELAHENECGTRLRRPGPQNKVSLCHSCPSWTVSVHYRSSLLTIIDNTWGDMKLARGSARPRSGEKKVVSRMDAVLIMIASAAAAAATTALTISGIF